MIRSQKASSVSRNGLRSSQPALLTSTSTWPKRPSAASTAAATLPESATSHATARALPPPWDRTLAGCLCAPLLAAAGAHELAASTAEGERVAVLAVDGRHPLAARRDSGSAHDFLSHSATNSALGAVGAARYVLGAPGADVFVVPVQCGDEVELFEAAGAVAPRTIVDRTRALADVQLELGRSLGTVSARELAAAGDAAAVLVAADALGAASRLLELTVQYVGERRQFGVPVGSFQAVKHAAAEMLVDVEAARSAVMHGAWAVGAGVEDASQHASIAKAVACAADVRVADKALFLHGAVGYTWEHDLQFPFKRTKSDALVFGSPDAHLDRVAAGLGLVADAQPVA